MTPTPGELVEAVRAAGALGGCGCEPELELREIEPGGYHAQIRHDSWCQLRALGGKASR